MTGARSAILGLLLAIAVTIAYQGIVRLVNASGARDQPATLLILLLAAFLGGDAIHAIDFNQIGAGNDALARGGMELSIRDGRTAAGARGALGRVGDQSHEAFRDGLALERDCAAYGMAPELVAAAACTRQDDGCQKHRR